MPATNIRKRACTLCAKKDIKYLSEHLKKKHKLMTTKERAQHLKRSLLMQKETDDFSVEHNSAVTCAATVCEELIEEPERDVSAEFREQERILSDNFQQLEDSIVALHLKGTDTVHSAMSMERIRLEVREKLMPLYHMVMKRLAKSLCDVKPPV